MSLLEWTEQIDGWRAGPFRIEYVGPRLWVLSQERKRRWPGPDDPVDRVVSTAGSLNILKFEAENTMQSKVRRARLYRRISYLLVAVLAVAVATVSAARWAPLVTVVGSSVCLVAALGVLDASLFRPYEHLKHTYQ